VPPWHSRSLLRVSGAELVSVSWGPNVTFVVRVQRPLVRAQLLQALAGVNELWSGAERLEICDEAGMLIVAAFRESFLRYRDATAAVRGVASMYGFYDAAVSVGQDGSGGCARRGGDHVQDASA